MKQVPRTLTVYYTYNGKDLLPLIRLQGLWLRQLGFECGDKVIVDQPLTGVLTIRHAPANRQAENN